MDSSSTSAPATGKRVTEDHGDKTKALTVDVGNYSHRHLTVTTAKVSDLLLMCCNNPPPNTMATPAEAVLNEKERRRLNIDPFRSHLSKITQGISGVTCSASMDPNWKFTINMDNKPPPIPIIFSPPAPGSVHDEDDKEVFADKEESEDMNTLSRKRHRSSEGSVKPASPKPKLWRRELLEKLSESSYASDEELKMTTKNGPTRAGSSLVFDPLVVTFFAAQNIRIVSKKEGAAPLLLPIPVTFTDSPGSPDPGPVLINKPEPQKVYEIEQLETYQTQHVESKEIKVLQPPGSEDSVFLPDAEPIPALEMIPFAKDPKIVGKIDPVSRLAEFAKEWNVEVKYSWSTFQPVNPGPTYYKVDATAGIRKVTGIGGLLQEAKGRAAEACLKELYRFFPEPKLLDYKPVTKWDPEKDICYVLDKLCEQFGLKKPDYVPAPNPNGTGFIYDCVLDVYSTRGKGSNKIVATRFAAQEMYHLVRDLYNSGEIRRSAFQTPSKNKLS